MLTRTLNPLPILQMLRPRQAKGRTMWYHRSRTDQIFLKKEIKMRPRLEVERLIHLQEIRCYISKKMKIHQLIYQNGQILKFKLTMKEVNHRLQLLKISFVKNLKPNNRVHQILMISPRQIYFVWMAQLAYSTEKVSKKTKKSQWWIIFHVYICPMKKEQASCYYTFMATPRILA